MNNLTNINFSDGKVWLPDFLREDQKAIVRTMLELKVMTVAAPLGTGGTWVRLVWAENVVRRTGGRVLYITHRVLCRQVVEVAGKCEIKAHLAVKKGDIGGVTVISYAEAKYFSGKVFKGVIVEEVGSLGRRSSFEKVAVTAVCRDPEYKAVWR